MKIFHVKNVIQKLGNGIISVVINLTCLKSKLGHDVYIISGGGEYEILLAECEVNHLLLNQERTVSNLAEATLRYFQLIQGVQPHIIHAYMMTRVALSWVLKKIDNYKLVSTVHDEF